MSLNDYVLFSDSRMKHLYLNNDVLGHHLRALSSIDHLKFFGTVVIQTWDYTVVSVNASSVLCSALTLNYFGSVGLQFFPTTLWNDTSWVLQFGR